MACWSGCFDLGEDDRENTCCAERFPRQRPCPFPFSSEIHFASLFYVPEKEIWSLVAQFSSEGTLSSPVVGASNWMLGWERKQTHSTPWAAVCVRNHYGQSLPGLVECLTHREFSSRIPGKGESCIEKDNQGALSHRFTLKDKEGSIFNYNRKRS